MENGKAFTHLMLPPLDVPSPLFHTLLALCSIGDAEGSKTLPTQWGRQPCAQIRPPDSRWEVPADVSTGVRGVQSTKQWTLPGQLGKASQRARERGLEGRVGETRARQSKVCSESGAQWSHSLGGEFLSVANVY